VRVKQTIQSLFRIFSGETKMKKLGRCLTAMVTPFKVNGDVDYAETKKTR